MPRGTQASYAESRFDRAKLDRYAARVAKVLSTAAVPTRGPELPSVQTRIERAGFLGLRRREITVACDGGAPRFWIVKTHFVDATRGARRSGPVALFEFSEGTAILLTPDGRLLSGSGLGTTCEPEGWTFTAVRAAMDPDILWMDNREGRWASRRPNRDEVWRDEWVRENLPGVHAQGVGISLALKRLLDSASAWASVSADIRGHDWHGTAGDDGMAG